MATMDRHHFPLVHRLHQNRSMNDHTLISVSGAMQLNEASGFLTMESCSLFASQQAGWVPKMRSCNFCSPRLLVKAVILHFVNQGSSLNYSIEEYPRQHLNLHLSGCYWFPADA